MIKSLIKNLDELRSMRGNYATYEDLIMRCYDIADEIEREVESNYIELPKDADGEYIHIGDRVEDNERVARIVLTDGSWEPSVYIEKLPGVLHEHFCNEISHYHAPTVEDVLDEFASAYDRIGGEDEEHQKYLDLIAEYAQKLKLKMEEQA